MNPRWLLYSTIIAGGGVVAGIGAFLIARALVPGVLLPLLVGLLTVVIVDVIIVVRSSKRLRQAPPPKEEE